MISDIILKAVDAHVAKVLPGIVEKVLDRELPDAILRLMRESVAKNPDAPMTPVGFAWAVTIAFQKRWPNVTHEEANRWMRDYLDTPYGAAGHTWTAATADEMVGLYVSEFGERQP